MKLRVVAEAEDELSKAMEFYEARQTGLGRSFYERVNECMAAIERDPSRFPRYEGLRRNLEFRRAIAERFPYVIIYKVLETETLVIAVAHSSRRPGYWKGRGE